MLNISTLIGDKAAIKAKLYSHKIGVVILTLETASGVERAGRFTMPDNTTK